MVAKLITIIETKDSDGVHGSYSVADKSKTYRIWYKIWEDKNVHRNDKKDAEADVRGRV